MRGFRLRPRQTKIEISKLDHRQIDFLCNAGIINKMIAKKTGVPWDQSKQDEFDLSVKVYFIVKKNMEYDVLFGNEFNEFLDSNGLTVNKSITETGKKCIDHFIKSL